MKAEDESNRNKRKTLNEGEYRLVIKNRLAARYNKEMEQKKPSQRKAFHWLEPTWAGTTTCSKIT